MAKKRGDLCRARTRKAFEAGGWGDSQLTCGHSATKQDKNGQWWCWQHVDRDKRY